MCLRYCYEKSICHFISGELFLGNITKIGRKSPPNYAPVLLHCLNVRRVVNKKLFGQFLYPSCTTVFPNKQFRLDFFNRENYSSIMRCFNPIPETSAKIEAIIHILRLNKYIGIY